MLATVSYILGSEKSYDSVCKRHNLFLIGYMRGSELYVLGARNGLLQKTAVSRRRWEVISS